MGKLSLKMKLVILTAILVLAGFAIVFSITLNVAENKVSQTMVEQFVNETSQVAKQAELILESGGTVDDLQKFVEDKTAGDSYFAYAVVIDTSVVAIAHSDTQKIGKNYLDDTTYTVPAAQNGEIKYSSFWADVQEAWTYDVMYPIYVNGELFGSMDVGIYSTQVDAVVGDLQIRLISMAAILTAIICGLISVIVNLTFGGFRELINCCEKMGEGDLTCEISESLCKRHDEVGKIAVAMNQMKQNLNHLLNVTNQNSQQILGISEKLNITAEDTKQKAVNIADKAHEAVEGTQNQSELSQENTKMTEQINKGMEEIAGNITHITDMASQSASEAVEGDEKLTVVVNQMNVIEQKVTQTYTQIQQLEQMSNNIENVVNLIADISSQTNLLALNASIEAARAGEQGKGFAVVAGEVGKLAEQSNSAADEIGRIITDIQKCIASSVQLMEEGNESVKEGIDLANEAKKSFMGIKESIETVSDDMTGVAAVTQEVTSGTATLYDAISKISGIAETINEHTESVSDFAKVQTDMMGNVIDVVESLNNLAQELTTNLKQFKLEA